MIGRCDRNITNYFTRTQGAYNLVGETEWNEQMEKADNV